MDWVKTLVTLVSNPVISHERVNKEWNTNMKKTKLFLLVLQV